MTKRELAYLLIGLGTGLLLSLAAVGFVLSQMFIMGFAWKLGSVVLALPFVMIFVGIVLLIRHRVRPNSN